MKHRTKPKSKPPAKPVVKVSISMPKEMLDKADQFAIEDSRTRSSYFQNLIAKDGGERAEAVK